MAKKQKEKKKAIVKVTRLYDNGDLLEQGYDKKADMAYFIRWNFEKESFEMQTHVEEENIKYVPMKDDLLQKGAIILPEEPVDYGTNEDLELEIEAFINTWLDVSEEHLQKAVWYVMLTWIIDNLHTIPYLRALGDYGCGKTRYLDVIGGICYKPMYVGGSVRSAPIYRVIDKWRGTAIFDEFTLGKSDETEDIVQILNNGYQRGKPVLRCADGNYDEVKAFDPFCAKILATRKEFYDKALESRCITEVLKTTSREIPIDLTKTFFKQRQELQNKLLMFRFKNLRQMEWDEQNVIDFGLVLPRVKQALSPFTILFQYDKERLSGFIDYVRGFNRKLIEDNISSFDGQLVNAYFQLLDNHDEMQQYNLDDYEVKKITSSDIKMFLVDDGWKEEKINVRTIGKHLKSLGFESHPMRMGKKTVKVLQLDDRTERALRMKFDVNILNKDVNQ